MTISSEQQRYYERELAYVRQSLDQFALQYPGAARDLGLKGEDPDISRLIDGMALLMANTQQRLDQQMPRIGSALLQLLYPAMLEITPSFACLALAPPEDEQAETEQLTHAINIPAATEFAFNGPHKQVVQFLSTTPIKVNPYQLAGVNIEIAPFHRDPPSLAHQANAKLSIELTLAQDFYGTNYGDFDFFIQGDERESRHIIELLLTQCVAITLTGVDSNPNSKESTGTSPVHEQLIAPDRLQSKLCDGDFQILPYGKGQFSGLDMLRDYLAFQDKGRFFTLKTLGKEMGMQRGNKLQLNVYLKQVPEHLLYLFNDSLLALNVIPVLNRFSASAEPVIYDFSQLDVPVVAEADVNSALQIISIAKVTELSDQGEQELIPLFREEFAGESTPQQQKNQPLYAGLRWQSEQKVDAIGQWQTRLSLTMTEQAPQQAKLLLAELWCCQGNLPCNLKPGSAALSQQAVDIPGQLILTSKPTAPQYPSLDSSSQWRLVKLLGASLSALLDHPAPEQALKTIFQLAAPGHYCESGDAILAVTHQAGIRPVNIGSQPLFVTGTDIEITLDPDKNIGLLAQLLNGFYQQFCQFDRYISVVVRQLGLDDSRIDFPLYTPWDER
ncbi:type VI secretion system baseplate subunit TssF [Thalassomonas sp. RHCl1]|uniref:type VI secretion system baseplate subunit TssF n=1 Tax=Thalassomonas sp. RHCl1 TaxID=2995320 RepID=UPI00248C69F3|nr:type VI secretion system baseplate subunit TssF [Thalassomonas sp. RHCl1]